jgi:hypothetical protein
MIVVGKDAQDLARARLSSDLFGGRNARARRSVSGDIYRAVAV